MASRSMGDPNCRKKQLERKKSGNEHCVLVVLQLMAIINNLYFIAELCINSIAFASTHTVGVSF